MKIRGNARKFVQDALDDIFNEEYDRELEGPVIDEGIYVGMNDDDEWDEPIDPEFMKHPISGCLYGIGDCPCQGDDDEDLRRDMLKQDLEMGHAVNDRMAEYYERFNS